MLIVPYVQMRLADLAALEHTGPSLALTRLSSTASFFPSPASFFPSTITKSTSLREVSQSSVCLVKHPGLSSVISRATLHPSWKLISGQLPLIVLFNFFFRVLI